ncbi:MAG: hypothetical protein JWO06_3311, partial [Bacteroidota bacterium]|nr:hypothetical protein [Bacteroidota bacterium]
LLLPVAQVAAQLTNFPDDRLGRCIGGCGPGLKSNWEDGTTDMMDEFNVQVYPNPFSDEFHLTVESSSEENLTVHIYDISGKLVEERKDLLYGTEITIGGKLSAGMYMIQTKQGENTKTIRVIKAE